MYTSIMEIDLAVLEDRIATQAATLDAATHALLADLRSWDEAKAWATQGARSCADWLSWRVGWSGTTAREHVRVARKLGELPAIDAALQRGEVSYCKVRAITRVATPGNEQMLLEDARLTTGAQLDKICRKLGGVLRNEQLQSEGIDRDRRYVRRTEREDGMVRIEAVLHPEEAALVWAALEATARSLKAGRVPADASAEAPRSEWPPEAAAERPPIQQPRAEPGELPFVPGFDRAHALVIIAERVLRGERVSRSPVELVITTTRAALEDPEPMDVAVTRDATCISTTAARRLACDAGVVAMVVDERGTPLDVGRRSRTVTAQLKRALEQRDQTCRFPGCECRLFTEAHHIEHWIDGGETKLSNLVRLCGHHHRFVHEYGYQVELDHDLSPLFKAADGRCVVTMPATSPASLRYDSTITPRTNDCGWDGLPLQYDLIIGGLYRATRSGERQPSQR
jgi:hypothetical protein